MAGSAFNSLDLGAHAIAPLAKLHPAVADIQLPVFFKPADRMFPLKVGDELFIDAPGAEVNSRMQFRFDVAFGEPGIIDGEPLVESLQGMADVVGKLVSNFASLL